MHSNLKHLNLGPMHTVKRYIHTVHETVTINIDTVNYMSFMIWKCEVFVNLEFTCGKLDMI